MLISKDDMPSELGLVHGEADFNLVTLLDFHVFTGYSYGIFDEMVKKGHHNAQVHNGRTGTNVNADTVASNLLSYLDEELPKRTR